jgi:nitrous oxidase accessory protein NosD
MRYASPRGFDRRGRGSRKRPFRTVERLVRSLGRGRTGCLLSGRYTHSGPIRIKRPGIVLRAAPGALATVVGAIWFDPTAHGARVSGLTLTTTDSVYATPLKVQADDVTVRDNRISAGQSAPCIQVGSVRTTYRTVIESNRVAGCGKQDKFDHLLYLQRTRDVRVRWNLLYGNRGGWAVHLYPDADHTLVAHNVIDGNVGGVVFAGNGSGDTSDFNLVRNNAITFSSPRSNLEGSWSDGPAGKGNLAELNCLFSVGPDSPAGVAEQTGFAARDNVVLGRSPYVRGRYAFPRHSRCARLVGSARAHLTP